jgi:hypothetical protein
MQLLQEGPFHLYFNTIISSWIDAVFENPSKNLSNKQIDRWTADNFTRHQNSKLKRSDFIVFKIPYARAKRMFNDFPSKVQEWIIKHFKTPETFASLISTCHIGVVYDYVGTTATGMWTGTYKVDYGMKTIKGKKVQVMKFGSGVTLTVQVPHNGGYQIEGITYDVQAPPATNFQYAQRKMHRDLEDSKSILVHEFRHFFQTAIQNSDALAKTNPEVYKEPETLESGEYIFGGNRKEATVNRTSEPLTGYRKTLLLDAFKGKIQIPTDKTKKTYHRHTCYKVLDRSITNLLPKTNRRFLLPVELYLRHGSGTLDRLITRTIGSEKSFNVGINKGEGPITLKTVDAARNYIQGLENKAFHEIKFPYGEREKYGIHRQTAKILTPGAGPYHSGIQIYYLEGEPSQNFPDNAFPQPFESYVDLDPDKTYYIFFMGLHDGDITFDFTSRQRASGDKRSKAEDWNNPWGFSGGLEWEQLGTELEAETSAFADKYTRKMLNSTDTLRYLATGNEARYKQLFNDDFDSHMRRRFDAALVSDQRHLWTELRDRAVDHVFDVYESLDYEEWYEAEGKALGALSPPNFIKWVKYQALPSHLGTRQAKPWAKYVSDVVFGRREPV